MTNKLKTAYELAQERFIAPRFSKEEEKEKPFLDFVPIEGLGPKELNDAEDIATDPSMFDSVNLQEFIEQQKQQDRVQSEAERKPLNPKEYKIEVTSSNTVEVNSEIIHYDQDVMEVHWHGHFLGYTGFSRLNRSMAFGLSDRGVRVKADVVPYLEHVNDATRKQVSKLEKTSISSSAPKVYGVTTPLSFGHGGRKIIYTMIESSEKVHENYAGKLNLMDEVWVPTEYGKSMLDRSNIHPPIYVMPLGIDTKRYNPNTAPLKLNFALNSFRFLSVFRWSYRKGFDIMLKAYLEEFSSSDDVSLLMATRIIEQPEEVGSKQIMEDFHAIRQSVRKSDDELPHIALYDEPIPERNMPKLYNACHAFVLISRGEGFCLPMIEAAACGLPVIASRCSGHSDFINDETAFCVEPDGYVQADINGKLSRMAKLCYYYEGQIFPEFGMPAIEQTKQHMRDAYENYDSMRKKTDKLRSIIDEKYTFDKSVDNVYNRLQQIFKEKK